MLTAVLWDLVQGAFLLALNQMPSLIQVAALSVKLCAVRWKLQHFAVAILQLVSTAQLILQ